MGIGNPVSLTNNVGSRTVEATATASQTSFYINGGYRLGQLGVYRNGVRLVDGKDYSAQDGANVILVAPASDGDSLQFHVFETFSVADVIHTNASEQTIKGDVNVVGGTLTGAAIGIQSAGTAVGAATTLNFVGTGNTFLVNGNTIDVSISGGSGGASKVYSSTIFAYDNIIESDLTVESPYKTSSIWTCPDVTVDIEDGVTVTVDDGCVLNLIDI